VSKIKAKTKISVFLSIALLISFISIFLSPKFVKSQEAVCGNGVCEAGEDVYNCPSDCPPVCGNMICEPGEDYTTCPADCPAPSYTEISSCMQITQPGEYRLVNDIVDSSASTCIDIQANDVILDCQGHIYNVTGYCWDNIGVYLSSSDNNNISLVRMSGLDSGIKLENSNNNTISDSLFTGFNNGIYLASSFNNIFSKITLDNNKYNGIYLASSFNNTLINSIIYNSIFGIHISSSGDNNIFNNIFNNTYNAYFDGTIYHNNWNTTLTQGTNIWNSSLGYIGGNLWTTPYNNGFSDTCVDNNFDGFCDQPYYLLGGSNIDYLPLAKYVGQGYNPLNISINTYNYNLVEKSVFYSGETVRIRANVTHDKGTSYIDKVLITIIDPSNNIVVDNKPMTAVSPIDNGYTYEYNYTLEYVSNGEWRLIVYVNDTLGYKKSSYYIFVVYKVFNPSGWEYRIPKTIDNTQNPNTLTNYQVLVTLDTATLISDGKMRTDCGDIRFSYPNPDETEIEIPYWIEGGCNSANTKIWVKVPLIPANSNTTIYVYYGNPNATSLSDFSLTTPNYIGREFYSTCLSDAYLRIASYEDSNTITIYRSDTWSLVAGITLNRFGNYSYYCNSGFPFFINSTKPISVTYDNIAPSYDSDDDFTSVYTDKIFVRIPRHLWICSYDNNNFIRVQNSNLNNVWSGTLNEGGCWFSGNLGADFYYINATYPITAQFGLEEDSIYGIVYGRTFPNGTQIYYFYSYGYTIVSSLYPNTSVRIENLQTAMGNWAGTLVNEGDYVRTQQIGNFVFNTPEYIRVRVISDKPVIVYTEGYTTDFGSEQIPSISGKGAGTYFVFRTGGSSSSSRPRYIRIIGTEPDTSVNVSGCISTSTTLTRGQQVEYSCGSWGLVRIASTKPVLVFERGYNVGEDISIVLPYKITSPEPTLMGIEETTTPPAPSYTEISSCTQITSPGEYRLVNDIVDSSASTCIDIQANDVILDCQGHIVDGVTTVDYFSRKAVRVGGYSNITIKNCVFKNWDQTIVIASSTNNYISNVTVSSSYYIGLYAYNLDSSIISDSIFDSNSIGLYIVTSNYNNIYNNKISNSLDSGIYIDSSYNLIYNNLFNNSRNLYFIGGVNYWNTTLQPGNNIWNSSLGYIGGNLWTNPNNNGYSDTCVDANYDGFCDDPYYLTSDGSNIDYLPLAKYVGQNAPSPPAPSYTEIRGCTQITQPGEYRLTQDIIDSSVSTCIDIQADNVILDCQGHIIDGVNASNSHGIYIYNSWIITRNVTIKNCILTDWTYGIYIYNVYSNTLLNLTTNYNYYGIYIDASDYNTLSNIISNSNYYGISVSNSNYDSLSNLTTDYNKFGIHVSSLSFSNIYNIRAEFNVLDGVSIGNSKYNNITNINVIFDGRYGVWLANSNYTILKDSVIQNNYQYGIYIYSSEGNSIYNNIFNNTNNFYFEGAVYTNYWNTTLQARKLTSGTLPWVT